METMRDRLAKYLINFLFKLYKDNPMALINTITGIAEGYLGDVGEWRKVLANNPSQLFGKLPPSLQADITGYYKNLKSVTDTLNIKGLEVDTKQADTVIKQLFNDKLGAQATKLDVLAPEAKKIADTIKQLDWLI